MLVLLQQPPWAWSSRTWGDDCRTVPARFVQVFETKALHNRGLSKFLFQVSSDLSRYHVNYCAMNRFRTLEMYRHPALANFDYFVQMDTDLYVKKPMPYNPVQRMAESKAVFGYHEKVVHPSVQQDCNLGLYDAISGWINRSELAPKYVPALGTNYAGNFNIGDLGFFRSEQYYAFARWIHNEETLAF